MEENNTIGSIIGIQTDNFNVTNAAGETVQLRVKFDYTSCNDNDIISWLNGNRRIAFQRPLRGLSVNEINDMDGMTINVNECGRKMKSRDERVNDLINAGIPSDLAGFAVDNPERFNDIMKNVSTSNNNEDE